MMRQTAGWIFLAALIPAPARAAGRTVLVVTAGGADYLLYAGGTIARLIDEGASVYVVRAANDEKQVHGLSAAEAAARAARESEAAAAILGVKKLVSLGYRAGGLGGVSPTELRDRIVLYIRRYRPDILFIPNPHAEYDEVLDRYYLGSAAEEAWLVAGLRNLQPPFALAGLEVHHTPELYYYAPPVDPRRREPEGPPTFVPQPVVRDIGPTFERKLRALRALGTIHRAVAVDIRDRLAATGRRLPLLDRIDEKSVNQLLGIRIRELGRMAARATPYQLAEEFLYAGPEYQVPSSHRSPR